MHLIISLSLLTLAIVIVRGRAIMLQATHGNWGVAIGLALGPVLLFFLAQCVIWLVLRLVRGRKMPVSDNSRSNYASVAIALLSMLVTSPDVDG